MLHRIFAPLAAVLLLVSAEAHAVTIGFEGVAPLGGSVGPVTPYTEGGFTFTNSLGGFTDSIADALAPGFVTNGTDHFGWCGGCGTIFITLTENGGNPFSLFSFEAGNQFIGTPLGIGEQLFVVGNLSGGGNVLESFPLVQDTLTPFVLSPAFTSFNLTSVLFFGSLTPGGVSIAIDNVVAAVPEPSAATAFVLGLGAVGCAVRRRPRS